MAVVAIKLKIMPESIEIDLKDIQKKVEARLMELQAKNISFVEENIAFGLKALIATFAWPEQQDTSVLESDMQGIDGISSSQIIDYRRAFG
jgi:elongation factor 1-beta